MISLSAPDRISAWLTGNDCRRHAAVLGDATLVLSLPVLFIMIRNQFDLLALPLPYVMSFVIFVLMLVVTRIRLHIQICMLRRVIKYSAGGFSDQGRMNALYLAMSYLMAFGFFGVMGTRLDLILMIMLMPTTLALVLLHWMNGTPPVAQAGNKQVSAYVEYRANKTLMPLMDKVAVKMARIV